MDLVKKFGLAPSQLGQYLSGTQQASSALQNVGAATPDLINTLSLHPESFDPPPRSIEQNISEANAGAIQAGARDALNPYTMDKSSSGSNTVNIGGLDPLQGYDVGVWIKDVGYRGNTGRSVLVGQFSSIVIAIKNVSDPYMAVGYRQPLYLDGEVQISFTLEKGLLDIDIFTETFGFAQFDREFRFNRTPRFEITFALDPVDWHALYKPGYQFGEKLERKPVGRFVLGRCKFETLNIGATSGKNVVATQWNGIAHSIRAHRDGSTPSSRDQAEKNSSALNVPHLEPDVEGARSGYLDPGKVALTDHSKDYQPESTATSGWFGEGKETLASLLTTLNSLKSTNVFGVSVSSLGLGAVLDSTIKVIQDRIAAFDPVRSTAAEGTTKSTQANSTDSKDVVELGNTSLLKERQDLLAQLIAAAGNSTKQAEVKAKLAEVEKKLDERDSALSKKSKDGFEQGVPASLTRLTNQSKSTDSRGQYEDFGSQDFQVVQLLRQRQDLLAQLIAAAGNPAEQTRVRAELDRVEKKLDERDSELSKKSTAGEGTTKSTQANSTDSKDGDENFGITDIPAINLLRKRQDLLAQLIAAAGNSTKQAEVKAKLAEVEKKLDERDSELSKRSKDGFEQGAPTNLTKLPEQTNSTAAQGTTKSNQKSSTASEGTKLLLTPEQSSAVDTLKSALSAKLNQLQVQLSQTTDKQQKQKLNQQIKEITAAIAATDTLQSVAYDLSVGGTQQPNTAGQGTTQINSAAPSVAGPGVKKVNPDTLSTDESEKKDAKFTAGPKQNPSTGGPGTTKVNPDTLSSD